MLEHSRKLSSSVMVRPASRESNLGISTSYESNFGISTSYEAFANFQTMAAKEQLIDYLHGLSSPIGENFILTPNGNCSSPGLIMLCCLVTTSSIMRSTRKETQQRSHFDLFQRAMGAKDQFFKPRMATDFDKAGSIAKTAVISFPQKTPHLDTDIPFSTFSES